MPVFSLVSLEAKFGGISLGPTVNGYVTSGGAGGPGAADALAPTPLTIPWNLEPASDRIIDLLNWRVALAEFEGRDEEMRELLAWADDSRRVLCRFVIGDGGTGKTRLAAELAERLREDGWSAGFARLDERSSVLTHEASTLLIVDYPEEHREGLSTLLAELARNENSQGRIRVLFLTRHSIGRWDKAITDSGLSPSFDWSHPLELGRLPPQPAAVVFNTAVHRGMEFLKTELGDEQPPFVTEEIMNAWLRRASEHGRALFISAAALYSALNPHQPVVSYSAQEIVTDLVARERRRLRAESKDLGLSEEGLSSIRAFATLCGGLDRERLEVLAPELGLEIGPPDQAWGAFQRVGLVRDGLIEPQTPDLLGACLIAKVREDTLGRATFGEWLWHGGGARGRDGIERMLRITYDAHATLGMSDALFLEELRESVQSDSSRCLVVHESIADLEAEWRSTPPLLGDLAVTVGRVARDGANDDESRAAVLNNLSNRLDAVGETDAALDAIRRAVETYERLATDQPARFEPDLAMSLHNLSNSLDAVGETDAALDAIRRAVETFERLATDQPARFEPDLARSYGTLGRLLRDIGMTADARKTFLFGAALMEKYATDQPETHPSVRLMQALLGEANRTTGDD